MEPKRVLPKYDYQPNTYQLDQICLRLGVAKYVYEPNTPKFELLSDCLVGFYHPRELGMDESPIQGLVWQRSINQLPVPLAPALPDFSFN